MGSRARLGCLKRCRVGFDADNGASISACERDALIPGTASKIHDSLSPNSIFEIRNHPFEELQRVKARTAWACAQVVLAVGRPGEEKEEPFAYGH